ncbi:MAG: hypothetical protein HKN91_03785 [Acidimicrobiia bacterium]|nr:hypothetical protein [Acidimicrobiia bacterium]
MSKAALQAPRPTPPVLRQTANLVARTGVVVAVSLIANVISARALGADGRGALAFALQAAFMVSFVVLLGSERAVAVVLPGQPISRSLPAVTSVSRYNAAVTAGVGVVALVATIVGTDLVWIRYVAPVTAMALASALSRALESSAINAHRAAIVLVNSGGASLVSLGLLAGLALADVNDPAIWVSAYAIGALLVGAALAHRFGLRSSSTSSRVGGPLLKQLSNTGKRLFPASLASHAAYRSDRLILPILADTEALGFYVVVASFTDIVAGPVEALSKVVLPRWRLAVLEGTFAPRRVFWAAGIYLSVAAVGSVLVGRQLIVPVFGEEYAASRELLPLLAFGSALFTMGRLLASYRLAQGHVNLASAADLVGMIAAIVAYVALIPSLGAQGAALGAIIGYASGILALLAVGGRVNVDESPVGDE